MIEAGEQRSHVRTCQVLGAQNPDPLSIGPPGRCNLVTELLRQRLTFLPGPFKEPERHTEIGRHVGNPQFFAEKTNTIFLQPGEIVKKRSLNASASALCESCMNYNPSRHVAGSPCFVLRSINSIRIVRHGSDATERIVGHALRLPIINLAVRFPYSRKKQACRGWSSWKPQPERSGLCQKGRMAAEIDRRLAQAPLQFFWIFEQLDYAFEQTARATAVDAAMIEAQCDLRFAFWNKFLLFFIPRGNFLPCAETK